jgi:ATP-binding cassette subfamily B protein
MNDSEKDILNTIYKLKDRLTIILCSHKKTVLDYCDKIYKIDNGTISQEK